MSSFSLFKYLKEKCDKNFLLASSSEKRFYDENASYFSNYPALNRFLQSNSSFALIQACIILKGLLNKMKIEKSASLFKSSDLDKKETSQIIHARLPYMEYKRGEKIYIPFFSPLVNRAYDKELNSLMKEPLIQLASDFSSSVRDPFDLYGTALYNSLFCSLIKIGEDKKTGIIGMYSIDMEMIYIIDSQGRLEEEIRVFDDLSKISQPKKDLFPRLEKLLIPYFGFDRDGFIDSLFELRFISRSAYDEICIREKEKDDCHGLR